MSREPMKGVRGIDDALWKATVKAAYNLDEPHGEFVSRALRRELEAMRAPPAGQVLAPEPQRPEPQLPPLTPLEVDAVWRVAQGLAERRTGKHQGRVTDRRAAVISKTLDAALGLPARRRQALALKATS